MCYSYERIWDTATMKFSRNARRIDGALGLLDQSSLSTNL
ncbi:hypothetical protein FDUTEX481_00213 [Tolypothrix sp. PCC 7601]|nr:hypothetical protein FDUTEX481_00213 [Tolypothrix sp. PCC 7601]